MTNDRFPLPSPLERDLDMTSITKTELEGAIKKHIQVITDALPFYEALHNEDKNDFVNAIVDATHIIQMTIHCYKSENDDPTTNS